MNWLQRTTLKLLRLPKLDANPVASEPAFLTLDAWQKDQKLVEHSLNLRRNRVYMAQLNVLRMEHPGHKIYSASQISSERLLGQIEGFQTCLDMLDGFAIPKKPRLPREEATFEPPEEKES